MSTWALTRRRAFLGKRIERVEARIAGRLCVAERESHRVDPGLWYAYAEGTRGKWYRRLSDAKRAVMLVASGARLASPPFSRRYPRSARVGDAERGRIFEAYIEATQGDR